MGVPFRKEMIPPMGNDPNRNPASTTRRAFVWTIGGCAALVAAIVAVYALTAPPTPVEAAEQYIEDNYDAVAESVVDTAFPDNSLTAEIIGEVAESIAEQVLPYRCDATSETGTTVEARCDLFFSLDRPLELRIEAPFLVSVRTTDRDLFGRTNPVVQDSEPLTSEIAVNGVALDMFTEAGAKVGEIGGTLNNLGSQVDEAKDILGIGGEKKDTALLQNDAGTGDSPPMEAPGQPTFGDQISGTIREEDEHRRRCRFWAMNNLQPVVYQEFARLEPENMDDLDRFLWRSILHTNESLGAYDDDDVRGDDIPALQAGVPGIYCRDYWAEPLDAGNVDLRNHGFESQCRRRLEERIINRYYYLTDAVNSREDDDLVFNTPNQYVRILQWLDISGKELLESGNASYMILQEQSRYPYAHIGDHIPNEDFVSDYTQEWESRPDLDWLGIVSSAGLSDNSSGLLECHLYHPQVFYGYWIPFDPDRVPDYGEEGEMEPAKFDPSTMPIFLPRTVDEDRVRAGYPLGKRGNRYHLCRGESEAEEAGYYYVDHPTGAYCERIQ